MERVSADLPRTGSDQVQLLVSLGTGHMGSRTANRVD